MAFAAHKKFKLYQMDVKSAFLNDFLKEEVYVKQPPGFIHEKYPNYVYKLKKYVYELRQSPRCWYERLSQFLVNNGFIIGLQINQSNAEIFIHQGKYIKDLLKRFALDHVTPKSTPMSTLVKLTKDEQDADYAGLQVDRKSTSGACEFLGDCLVVWHRKKQTSVALSTAEGEYIAAGSCCAQILWMQQILQDFALNEASPDSFERHAKESGSKILTKPILKERNYDIELLTRVGVYDLFKFQGCESLLSPEEVIYPELVREFYANFQLLQEGLVFSNVRGTPVVLKADALAIIGGLSDQGVCPFTTHQAFVDVPGLQYEEQLKAIVGEKFVDVSIKPSILDLTPLSLLVFKLFHTNLLPRKSGRDRITFQDSILFSMFVKKVPCDVSSLIIKNMHHCSTHESVHLPYPSLLSKVFRYFCVSVAYVKSEKISTLFDLSVLTANNLFVSESNELHFDETLRPVGGLPKSPNYASYPSDRPTNSLLNLLLVKLNENLVYLANFNQHFTSVETLGSLNSQVIIMNVSFELFRKFVCSSLDSINAKLSVLHASDVKLAKTMDFEFGTLQEGLDKSKIYWHKKRDWIGDCTLEEITAPLPLPAIPPPSVFGITREEYKAKIFDWIRERDDKAPAQDAFDKLFSEYGSAPVFPTAKDKALGSGKDKGKAPVNVDDSFYGDERGEFDLFVSVKFLGLWVLWVFYVVLCYGWFLSCFCDQTKFLFDEWFLKTTGHPD
ncbi:hypothetical protein AgCh_019805 [Apium graveolens]